MNPPRKILKTDGEGMDRTPDGTIQFEVGNILSLPIGVVDRYSPEIEVGGVHWSAIAWRDEEDLNVSLARMDKQSTPWRIDVKAECILVHSDITKNLICDISDTFDNSFESSGDKLITWEEFKNDEKGFIIDNKIRFEVRFWITDMTGVKTFPRIDFTDSNDPINDVVLVVNGEKIYVNKGILATYSSFFKSLFYGNFAEKDKNEIELKDIDREEFLEMLHVIYPSCKKITSYSAPFLVELGDRFQIVSLIDNAEKVIINSESIPIADKLKIAEKFNLTGLMDHCLSTLTKTEDFKDLEKSLIGYDLSNVTKGILYDRLLKIAK